MAKMDKNFKRELYVKKTTLYTVACICLAAGAAIVFLVQILLSGKRDVRKQTILSNYNYSQNQSLNNLDKFNILEEKVRANPGNAAAWAQLGHLYFDNKIYEKAINAYKKHLNLNPRNADVWTDLGIMYRRVGQFNHALEAFQQAIKINPEHQQSRLNKGIVLFYDLKKQKEGILEWENLLKVNPEAKTGRGTLLKDFLQKLKKDKNL